LGARFHKEKISGTEYTTDGNLDVNIMPAAIRECKNDSGHALNQVILYYTQFLQGVFNHGFYHSNTSFPCILMIDIGMSAPRSPTHVLMGYAGPSMGFYGAACSGMASVRGWSLSHQALIYQRIGGKRVPGTRWHLALMHSLLQLSTSKRIMGPSRPRLWQPPPLGYGNHLQEA